MSSIPRKTFIAQPDLLKKQNSIVDTPPFKQLPIEARKPLPHNLPKPKKNNRRRKYSPMQVAMVSAAAMIFVAGMSVSIMGYKTNQEVKAQIQTETSQNPNNDTDETPVPPDAVNNYKVAPDQPRRVSIQKIGVNARIFNVGVGANNELIAPKSIYDVGWYNASSKPGQAGAILLDGHVHGRTAPGVFYGLKNLEKGDIIEVERGDGKTYSYSVETSKSYDADHTDMKAAVTPIDSDKPGLNIITCGGSLTPDRKGYEERLIVFASQIK